MDLVSDPIPVDKVSEPLLDTNGKKCKRYDMLESKRLQWLNLRLVPFLATVTIRK